MAEESIEIENLQQKRVSKTKMNVQQIRDMSTEALNQANESVFGCKFFWKNL